MLAQNFTWFLLGWIVVLNGMMSDTAVGVGNKHLPTLKLSHFSKLCANDKKLSHPMSRSVVVPKLPFEGLTESLSPRSDRVH
jgi:hypothetical protein